MLTRQAGGAGGGPWPCVLPSPEHSRALPSPGWKETRGRWELSPSSSRTSQAEPRSLGKGACVSLSRDFLCSQESRSGLSRCTDVKSKFKITSRRSPLPASTSGQVGPSASYPPPTSFPSIQPGAAGQSWAAHRPCLPVCCPLSTVSGRRGEVPVLPDSWASQSSAVPCRRPTLWPYHFPPTFCLRRLLSLPCSSPPVPGQALYSS